MYAKADASSDERKTLGERVSTIVRALGGVHSDRKDGPDRSERWRPAAPALDPKPEQLKLV
jgi:hypothetical protein